MIKNYVWTMAREVGYTPCTTFWEDFNIADAFGKSAVLDTIRRGKRFAKTNIKYMTELVMVLNHRCWVYYSLGEEELSKLYADEYYKLRDWVYEHYEGEDLEYFVATTD